MALPTSIPGLYSRVDRKRTFCCGERTNGNNMKMVSLLVELEPKPMRQVTTLNQHFVLFRRHDKISVVLAIALGLTACRPQRLPQNGESRNPRALYAAYCQSCHGADGRNDRGGALPRMRLSTSWSLSETAWLALVADGRGDMPAFRSRLNSTETRSIRSFVLSVSNNK